MWEGNVHVDLLDTFAPWAKDEETKAALYTGIPCTIVDSSGSTLECMPVSETVSYTHLRAHETDS